MRVVIIGGGSAGTTCAFELRKLDKKAEITILEKGNHTEYSPCALPYVVSGETNLKDIVLFSENDYSANDINLRLNSEVEKIDREKKTIRYARKGESTEIIYDKLVIATGSSPFVPSIEGLEGTQYHVLKTIEDAKDISLKGNSVVIGAGFIGVELAHSLAQRGENVSLIEVKETILPGLLDKKMAGRLKEYLEFNIYEGTPVRISGNEVSNIPFDNLFICTGMRPNIAIAKECGLETDKAIVINDYLQTSDEDIYACGDCSEVTEFYTGNKIVSGLGTTAVRQAKVIAKNLLGAGETFPPVMNNSVTKIGDVFVGAVGVNEGKVAAEYSGPVRAEYYSSKERIAVRIVCDSSGRVIGGQLIGSEVVGRLNLIALAISKGMHVRDLAELETCYNPASAPIFDPVSIAAQICLKKVR